MSRHVVFASWDDAPHLSPEAKREMEATMLPHEKESRMRGVPSLGSGAIYPVPEEDFVVESYELPAWHRRMFGLDVGWATTACIWLAINPENDVATVYDEWFRGQSEPEIHARAILTRGSWIRGVCDPAAGGRSQADGRSLLKIYAELGVNLQVANNSVESGIYSVWSRLSTGRLKVFKSCQRLLAEMRIYRRDANGKVVKAADHGCDALRYAVMSGLSLATAKPSSMWNAHDLRDIPGAVKTQHEYEYSPYDRNNR